jgi:hypothetical protein
MKKLLALILCVMMFVAVIPTAAFAYTPTVGWPVNQNRDNNGFLEDQQPTYLSKTTARRAVENLGKDINAMYTALAADQTVFGTAKTIYDMTDALSKDLLKGIGSYTYYTDAIINGQRVRVSHEIYEDDLATNVRKSLNGLIGNTITNYMNDRVSQFTSETTNAAGEVIRVVKPEKYLEVWGKAVENALSSEKAQKNIEAMVTGLFALKVQKDVNDGANDLYTDIVDWDHWNEFKWGKLGVDVIDPDGAGVKNWSVWNPVPGAEHYGALIATDSRGLDTNAAGIFATNALLNNLVTAYS